MQDPQDFMDKARWEKLQSLFDAALKLTRGERDAFLLQQCQQDSVLLEEVRAMLTAHISREDILKRTSVLTEPRSLQQSTRLPAGHEVGPYQILEEIGAGGMGVIYKATDMRLQRTVALKFLPVHLHADPMMRQRFIAEARTASQLDNPHVCVIHDIGETLEGQIYIAMSYYDGETLATRITRGPLEPEQAIDIAIQICDGLEAAHSHGIVHRDIKPANIMLTKESLVKILDFGIAKVADVKLTGTGVSIGTLAYMAPEQLNGEEADTRADIWALGVTLYEMLSGNYAFSGKGKHEALHSIIHSNSNPADSLPAHVPGSLRDVLERALQRDREQRYQGMAQMMDHLISARSGAGSDPTVIRTQANIPRSDAKNHQWDPAFLDAVADMLTQWIGPIASRLVQRSAKQAQNLDELYAQLADRLPDTAARNIFQEQLKIRAAMHTKPPAPNTIPRTGERADSSTLKLSPIQLSQLESALLPHLGPIAAALIRRTVAKSASWGELCDELAQHLASDLDRDRFLRAMENTSH